MEVSLPRTAMLHIKMLLLFHIKHVLQLTLTVKSIVIYMTIAIYKSHSTTAIYKSHLVIAIQIFQLIIISRI